MEAINFLAASTKESYAAILEKIKYKIAFEFPYKVHLMYCISYALYLTLYFIAHLMHCTSHDLQNILAIHPL